MWELDHKESWVPKNWWFWIVVLQKTLESPLDFKEIQPVHPKEISPECSLEGLMLKLKPQYFGHLIRRTDSFEKTLILGKIEPRGEGDNRGWDGWMASPTQWIWVWVSSRSWWWTGKSGVLQSPRSPRVRHDLAIEQQQQGSSLVSIPLGGLFRPIPPSPTPKPWLGAFSISQNPLWLLASYNPGNPRRFW